MQELEAYAAPIAPTAVVDHVAVLVASVEGARDRLAGVADPVGQVEEFPGEGTRECYIGSAGATGRLLLMEAAGDGPYARALARRGPGLHHVALAVPDLQCYVAALAGTGWYLLPGSLDTIRDTGTAWLARPGVPTLLEISADPDPGRWQERGPGVEPVVSRVEIPEPPGKAGLIASLAASAVCASADSATWLTVGTRRLRPDEI